MPGGAFYAFPKVIRTGMNGSEFSKKCMHEAGAQLFQVLLLVRLHKIMLVLALQLHRIISKSARKNQKNAWLSDINVF